MFWCIHNWNPGRIYYNLFLFNSLIKYNVQFMDEIILNY